MIREILITKYPYFFWNMKKEQAEIDYDKFIVKNTKKAENEEQYNSYSFVNFAKWKYLTLKYLPIFLFFFIVFNRLDFAMSSVKLFEYLTSIFITLVIFFTKRIYVYIVLAITLIGGVYALESIPFVVKYTLCFICIFTFIYDLDSGKNVYSIVNKKGKSLSQFYILEDGKDD